MRDYDDNIYDCDTCDAWNMFELDKNSFFIAASDLINKGNKIRLYNRLDSDIYYIPNIISNSEELHDEFRWAITHDQPIVGIKIV